MRNNTFFYIIIALGLCLSMTGCGTEKENTNNTVDSSNAAVKDIKEQTPTAEILEADIDSGKVQLGNTVFTLPVTLNEILEAGGTNKSEYDPEVALIKNEIPQIMIEYDGFDYGLWVENSNDEMQLLKDCIVYQTGFLGSNNENKNMIFPKGVKAGMSLTEVKNIYGEPTGEYELKSGYVYEFGTDKTTFDAVVDLKTQIVQDIVYGPRREIDE